MASDTLADVPLPLPTVDELNAVGLNMRRLHQELIKSGNEKQEKEKAYRGKEELLAKIVKLLKEGNNREAMELFAPGEYKALQEAEDALANKTNEFNDLSFESRRLSSLIEVGRIRVEAKKLGLDV